MKHFLFFLIAGLGISNFSCDSIKRTTKSIQPDHIKPSEQFEGKIVYDMIMKDNTGEVGDDMMSSFMGNELTYYLKGNQYKTVTNGLFKITQVYTGGDTLYNIIQGTDMLFWIDVTKNPYELIEYNFKKNAKKINGKKCNLITIKTSKDYTEYYYDSDLKLSYENFKNHKYGFWNLYLEKTGSIANKTINEDSEIYLELTIKEIIEEELSNALFEIPNYPRTSGEEGFF